MPASNIDFTVPTHIIHFSVVPNTDGSLNSNVNVLTADYSADLVSRAHAAGRKVLFCVGGGGSGAAFQAAAGPTNLNLFIGNLTNFMAGRGYDGIDIDWEPLTAAAAPAYTNLVQGLRSALNAFPTRKLLTAAVAAYPPYGDPPSAQYAMFAALQGQFDQINIMTYDLSGPYSGWVTWFNSPLYDGGYRFASTGALVPSVDGSVSNFIANGVVPGKLGIGIPFYGYVWTGGGGVWQPRQSWPPNDPPAVSAASYYSILSSYYSSNAYCWDAAAQAAYLSITNSNPANDLFISFDDPRACEAKASFARNHGLGGLMIWELAQDFFPARNGIQREPLLQAIKDALATPGWTGIQFSNQAVSLNFTGAPLGAYRVQWTSDLSNTDWNTLTVTNVLGLGGLLWIEDPAAVQTQRFYRVQTPP